MKSIFKYFVVLGLFMSVGCSKDDSEGVETDTNIDSYLDDEAGISYFYVDNELTTICTNISNIDAHLTLQSSGDYYKLQAFAEHFEEFSKVGLHYSDILEDGSYLLELEVTHTPETKSTEEIESFLYLISLQSMKLTSIEIPDNIADNPYSQLTVGSGTVDNPYQIASATDFENFKGGLTADATSGKGIYFKQTASFASPSPGDYDDSYSSCCNFAGSYDGGGYSITSVDYNGGTSETSNIGLFAILLNGAEVKDLSIDVSYNNAWDNCGGLAGKATGTVSVSNVSVSGDIINARNTIGGLIGYASGTTLTMNECFVGVTITGAQNIGGLIGAVSNSATLYVKKFTNVRDGQSQQLYLSGSSQNVGGVVGSVSGSKFTMDSVTLRNSITEEYASTRFIQTATKYCGGIIGYLSNDYGESTLSNIKMYSPVYSAGSCAGGLVGYATLGHTLTLTNCKMSSYVIGYENAGGFFGSLHDSENLIFDTGNSIVQDSDAGYLAVHGTNNVGGVIGSATGDVTFANSFTINVNVTGTGSNVGGCIGIYNSGGTLHCKHLTAESSMTVTGHMTVGGLVGYLLSGASVEGLISSSISGKIESLGGIPSSDTYSSLTVFGGKVVSESTYAGGIVGYMDGSGSSLTRLCFTGSVDSKGDCGGIVGHIKSGASISGCVNIAEALTCTGVSSACVGGLVGTIDTYAEDISYVVNYADIEPANNGGYVGGLIGYIGSVSSSAATIENLINVGDVTSAGCVSGIIGTIASTNGYFTLNNLVNYGSVTSSGGDYIAGILANGSVSYGTFKNCVNHGNISASTSTDYTGGIAGCLGEHGGISKDDNVKMLYCCNRGEVSSSNSSSLYVGGLIGHLGEGKGDDWGVYDCYNSGALPSNHVNATGGLIGCICDAVHVKRGLNIGEVSYGNGCIGTDNNAITYLDHLYYLSGTGNSWSGTSFSSDNGKKSSTFSGFDFDSVWTIGGSVNDGYPYLQGCKYQSIDAL